MSLFCKLTCLFAAAVMLMTGCSSTGDSGGGGFSSSEDLTKRPWFPPVTRQQSYSCSQQTGLYYLFTSEWNRTHGLSAATTANRFSPYFSYALLASDKSGRSHVVDGWRAAQYTGVPLEADSPRYSNTLMHGYDRYLRAMRHRVADWDLIPVRDEAGIRRAKSLIAAGHPLACDFQIRDAVVRTVLPPPVPGGGKPASTRKVVQQWGTKGAGHAMVYAGYDDSIGFDFNRDGKITSNVDITGDGRVTLADQERGAFLVVNPWGSGWGENGRAWAPYRHHAVTKWPWSGYVGTVRAQAASHPRLTLKLRLRAADRQNVVITAGDGTGREIQPWMFSHTPERGADSGSVWDTITTLRTPGPHLSAGRLANPEGGPLETGHDLSALGRSDTYTLEIRPAGRGRLSGELASASFLEYDGSGRLLRETPVRGLPAVLPAGGGKWPASR